MASASSGGGPRGLAKGPSPPAEPELTRRRALFLLGALYVCEGLPFGFQATALPVFLRAAGLDLASIGFLGALSLPWLLKPLWAPWVDAYGTRRAWILPLILILALVSSAAVLTPPETRLAPLLGLVFLMNLVAATLDVAVDGLAVDVLPEGALGSGNAAQVVGYKVGMLGGGGLLVWASAQIGWAGLFGGMGALLGLALLVALRLLPRGARPAHRAASAKDVLRTLGRALRLPGSTAVLALAGTYKLGETLVDVMWRPYLVDAGYAPAELGRLLGTFGLLFSLAGSLAGGLWTTRVGSARALLHTSVLRAGPLGLIAGLAFLRSRGLALEPVLLEAATMLEAFFGGAITTALFAFMMARVDRRVGGTHFTLLAAVEVAGKMPAGLLSGIVATHAGYPATFGLGFGLAVAFALAVPALAPRSVEARPTPG